LVLGKNNLAKFSFCVTIEAEGGSKMATLSEMVFDYHKKNHIVYQSEEYVYTYNDGSTIQFFIQSAEKYKALFDHEDKDWYDAYVMTKRFSVFCRTVSFPQLDWFDGKSFLSINSAINAIKRNMKE